MPNILAQISSIFQKEESLDLFLEQLDDLLFILEKDYKFKKVSKSAISFLGYTKEELDRKTFLDIVFKEDWTKIKPIFENPSVETKKASIRLVKKNMEVGWFDLTIDSEHKNVFLVVANNVSVQKETEGRLSTTSWQVQEEKARLSVMLENIGDGIIGTNDGGEITYINPQAEQMLGIQADLVVGQMMIHAVKVVDDNGVEVPINKIPIHSALLSKKKVTNNKLNFIKNDGSRLPVAVTATPIEFNNRVIGGVTVFRDITKERDVDRMKTEFISLASHQLRTPLSAMKWFAELLLDDSSNFTAEQKELIQNIYVSNDRMIELVNALLNISRIESGRIIIEPKPTDLSKLVGEVVTELQPKLKEKGDHLGISVHHDLPQVNIDPKLIRHVYMNLLTNAIKYSPPGGDIVVMISKTDKDVVSQVSDSGYGIPKEQQSKVFQKFFRADNIIKIETDGTGLGLYLIKSIIESSGGKVWFKSEEGKGTTFWFSLPLSGSAPKKGEVTIDS